MYACFASIPMACFSQIQYYIYKWLWQVERVSWKIKLQFAAQSQFCIMMLKHTSCIHGEMGACSTVHGNSAHHKLCSWKIDQQWQVFCLYTGMETVISRSVRHTNSTTDRTRTALHACACYLDYIIPPHKNKDCLWHFSSHIYYYIIIIITSFCRSFCSRLRCNTHPCISVPMPDVLQCLSYIFRFETVGP